MAELSNWQLAQRTVIGSLMISPDEVSGLVFQSALPAMFGDPAMRHVFEAARDLFNDGRPIDPMTVVARAGNEYYDLVSHSMEMTPTAANVGAYLATLRDEAKLAALQTEAMTILNAKNVADAMTGYERMGKMLGDTETDDGMSLSEMISAYIDRMNDPKPVDYLRFGIDLLDRSLAISPGTFIIIGADSSAGKTALALQFAVHIAKTGKRVGFFSLETPEAPLQNRLMAEMQLAGIPMPNSQHKKLSDDDMRRAMEAGIRSAEIPVRFFRKDDTMEKIRAKTIRHRLEVIFIDYVQLIACPGEERWQVVTKISMGLHRMAQELGVTIVGLSQITPEKGRKDRSVTVDDLRESRQLKQDAEVVLLLNRGGEEDDESLRILDVGKNKDGWRPSIKLKFDAEYMTFSPYVDMDTIRSDGRTVRQQQEVQRKAKEKEEPDPIPKDLAPGEFAEVQVSLDEIPF